MFEREYRLAKRKIAKYEKKEDEDYLTIKEFFQ